MPGAKVCSQPLGRADDVLVLNAPSSGGDKTPSRKTCPKNTKIPPFSWLPPPPPCEGRKRRAEANVKFLSDDEPLFLPSILPGPYLCFGCVACLPLCAVQHATPHRASESGLSPVLMVTLRSYEMFEPVSTSNISYLTV